MDALDRESLAATAEAALAAALCLALLPAPRLFLAPLVAAALLVPALLNRMPARRRGEAVFAPDPLAPDFVPLVATLREMIEDAQADGARRRLVLTPLPASNGGFDDYGVLWRPGENSSAVEVEWRGSRVRRRTAAAVLPKAPMPLRVGSHPVRITISRDSRTGRAVLAIERPWRPLRTLNPLGAPLRSAYIAYLAALLGLLRVFPPQHAASGVTFAVLAAAPILLRRLADFAPRLRRNLP